MRNDNLNTTSSSSQQNKTEDSKNNTAKLISHTHTKNSFWSEKQKTAQEPSFETLLSYSDEAVRIARIEKAHQNRQAQRKI